MKTYTLREFVKLLNNNGYRNMTNQKGSHYKFFNRRNRQSISIPCNHDELNPALTTGIIRRYKLSTKEGRRING